MKITFLSNIPSPYRIDFFNELGKYVDLKVVFEAERNYELNEKWYYNKSQNFKCIFLEKGKIKEKRINWNILRHLKRRNQDLIVVTNYSYFTELVALLYIKLMRIPYCLEVDGGILKKESTVLYWIKRFLIRGAIAYISPSLNTDIFLENYGVEKEKIYRYNFTSLKEKDILINPIMNGEKKDLRKKLMINESKMIVAVGRYVHIKGFDVLINSAKSLYEDIGIYIIGGEATKEYKELVERLELKNIHFVGFKSKEKLKEYYKAADLFVLPTRGDVWGLVINEAMACGLPVVTTDKCVAGIELIHNEENGYIIPVNNEDMLSKRIKEILEDDLMIERMKQENLRKIRSYTIENMVNRHIYIFSEILESVKLI